MRDNVAAQRRRRHFSAGFAALGLILTAPMTVHTAAADPFDAAALRGSSYPFTASSYSRWDGINFGVGIGLSNMNSDFGNSTRAQVGYILRSSTLQSEYDPSSWTSLPSNSSNSKQFGGFLGYNLQYDQLVLGIDGAYNRPSSLSSSSSDSINRAVVTSDGVTHNVLIVSQASIKLVDYATVRARAGYAMSQFLPYAFVGVAAGRFNYSSTATVTDIQTPAGGGAPSAFGPISQTDSKNDAVVGGFVAGAGLDVAVLPNVFLRAEWEFIAFAPVHGIRVSTNTGRVGIGVKF
ncbi:MAG: outer membrane beta-barrel protein [Pseudolabrys sp.]